MYFGSPVWPLQWNFPYDAPIKTISKLGCKGVELIGWNAQAFDEYYTKDTISHLNKLLADLGMCVTNFNFNPGSLAGLDAAARKTDMETYRRAAETAAALGSKTLTSVAPYPMAWKDSFRSDTPQIQSLRHVPWVQVWTIDNCDLNVDWDGLYEIYVGHVKECCEITKSLGMKTLIEAHPYRMVNSAQSMLRLIDHVDMDNLGMNFDPSHMFPSGDMPQVAIHQLGKRIGHTHFSDNDTLTNVHWRPGKGKIDWYAVMKALRDVGYDGAINMELEDVPGAVTPDAATTTGRDNAMETEIALSMEYIRGICKSLHITI